MADYGQEHLAKVMQGNQDRAEDMERAKKYMAARTSIHNKVMQHEGQQAQAIADSINKRRYEGND